MGYGFKILVEGEYALFTRPEFKVERVSYDVPTVSAMEGLIKSIYWKPAIRIVIEADEWERHCGGFYLTDTESASQHAAAGREIWSRVPLRDDGTSVTAPR